MTFKDVSIKNFKFNIRKYKAYILSCSFSVMIFFMYLTLFFNEAIVKKFKGTPINDIMSGVLVIIVFYSLFFISYAQASFFKSRKKELGLFLTLGMIKKDINKMMGIENTVIAFISIIVGLISGTVFARVFFMFAVKVLDSKDIKFSLNCKSFVLAVAVFIGIFLINTLITLTQTSKLSISELFMESRKSQQNKINSPIIGFIGFGLIVTSYILMYYYMKGKIFSKSESTGLILILVCCAIGIYIFISQIGSLIISFMKKNKPKYYKNIISITEVNYKFSEYKKILYIICVLSALTVFFIGSTYGTYVTTLKTVLSQNPYDIMYVETYNGNKLSQNQLNSILNGGECKATDEKTLNFANLLLYKDNLEWGDEPVVSDEEFNRISNLNIHVKEGYASVVEGTKGMKTWCEGVKKIKISNGKKNNISEFKLQEEVFKYGVNYNNYSYCYMIILNDNDYKNLLNTVDKKSLGKFHLLNFENWKNTKNISENLISKLKQINKIDSKKTSLELSTYWGLFPASKIQAYEQLKTQSSFILFVMCCIGLLFFLSSGVILYFKIYTDFEDGRERYNKLYRIGIMDGEMKKAISKELRLIFFVPVFIGSVIAYLYMSIILSGFSGYKNIMINSLVPIALYFIFQIIFYNVTRKRYISEILD